MKENTNSRPTIEKLKDTGYYLTANAMSNPIIKIKEGKKIFYQDFAQESYEETPESYPLL